MNQNPVFLFPGQGKQNPKQLQTLLQKDPSIHQVLRQWTTEEQIKKLIHLDEEESHRNSQSQPLLGLTALAFMHQLKTAQITASAVAGLSAGEWLALVAAEVIPPKTVMPLLIKRGELMSTACQDKKQGMAALVGGKAETASELIKRVGIPNLYIANYNSQKESVVSGLTSSLKKLQSILQEELLPFRMVPLKTEGAFHTPYMKEAEEQLKPIIESIPFSPPQCPFFSSVSGKEEKDPDRIKTLMLKQMSSPVWWQPVLKPISRYGNIAVEMGSGTVLQGLWKREVSAYSAIGVEEYLHQLQTEPTPCKEQVIPFHFLKEDPFYQNHFKGFAVVPGTLIIESFLRTIEKTEEKPPSLIVEHFQFKRFTTPNQAEARIIKKEKRWHCELFQKGVLTAKGVISREENK